MHYFLRIELNKNMKSSMSSYSNNVIAVEKMYKTVIHLSIGSINIYLKKVLKSHILFLKLLLQIKIGKIIINFLKHVIFILPKRQTFVF